MKKLLIFHSALAPYRIDFFNALAENYDCTVIFLSRNNRNQPFNQEKLLNSCKFKYAYMDTKLVIKNRDFNFGYLFYLLKYKPNIVIGGEYGLPTLLPYIYKILLRRKYSLYTICDDSIKMAEDCRGIRKKLRKMLVPRLNGLILISKEVVRWYKSNLQLRQEPIVFPIIKEEKIYNNLLSKVLPISLDYQKQYQLNGKKIFLYIGRLAEEKNLPLLISVMKNIPQDDMRLILIGDGEKKEELLTMIHKYKLENKVILTGRFEGDELYAWYNIADLFILPSNKYEAFGAVTAEALQAGCPVACSAYAGSACLIKENINGNIFNPNSPDELEKIFLKYSNISARKNIENGRSSLLLSSFNDYVKDMVSKLNEDD